MKKSSKKKLRFLFWLVFAAGCAWVALVPPTHRSPSTMVTVKVQPAETSPPLPQEKPVMGGEETTMTPPPAPVTQGEKVTVPVVPEKQEPVAAEKQAAGGAPKIAIVIDDVGVDLKGSARAIALPAPVTLSFLPYAVRLREQAKAAQAEGHEMLLHMPMEPVGHEDPGPGALLVDLPMPELQQRFETALASFTGFDGVNNHMGSKFTAYADGMNMVMDELQQRHLFFLDSRTSAASVGMRTAQEKHVPVIGRDVFLDDVQSPDAIRAQLAETERIARHKGYAVAIGHPHAATMDVMETWVTEAPRDGFELVPLRELVRAQAQE